MNIQQVIREYQQLIYGIALTGTGGNRADAEDVFQETFLAYFRQTKRFRKRNTEKLGSFAPPAITAKKSLAALTGSVPFR